MADDCRPASRHSTRIRHGPTPIAAPTLDFKQSISTKYQEFTESSSRDKFPVYGRERSASVPSDVPRPKSRHGRGTPASTPSPRELSSPRPPSRGMSSMSDNPPDTYRRPSSQGSDSPFIPTPPPNAPTRRTRPSSAKGRHRPVSGRSIQQQPVPKATSHDSDLESLRPMSAKSDLNKYALLPSIGNPPSQSQEISESQSEIQSRVGISQSDIEEITQQTSKVRLSTPEQKSRPLYRQEIEPKNKVNELSPETMPKLKRKLSLPPEPGEQESRLLLAVKTPSGNRHQRYFRMSEKLETVLNFAEISEGLDFTGFILVSMPRREFPDLTITIQESQLENKTLLHLQMPGD